MGEELPISLNWLVSRRYLAWGNVFVVLKKDGALVKENKIGKCVPCKYFISLRKYCHTTIFSYIVSAIHLEYLSYESWNLKEFNLDESFTKLVEVGRMELNLYFPLWNSSGWVNATFNYTVKGIENNGRNCDLMSQCTCLWNEMVWNYIMLEDLLRTQS